jgi:hypothetical protein
MVYTAFQNLFAAFDSVPRENHHVPDEKVVFYVSALLGNPTHIRPLQSSRMKP